MSTQRIVVPRWFDRHLHLRDGVQMGEMLHTVLPCTINQRATGAVIMGNLKHPDETSTIEKAIAYRDRIRMVIPHDSDFRPIMTCYLTDDITPAEVKRGYWAAAWSAVKLYIAGQKGVGGTTNSAHGVKDLVGRYPVFAMMEEQGIPLLGHFEDVDFEVDEFDREIFSIEHHLMPLLKTFPELKVVVEHITDGRAADFVADTDYDVCATVTAHHLMINRNMMFWGGMNPGYYCKPVPKREEHRQRVRKYVTSGNRRFGAGTDSAPHDEGVKSHCYGCAAGIFTATHAVELYTTVFDEDSGLQHLGPFLSENFLEVYGVQPSNENMTIEKSPMHVPKKVGSVQVFKGGTELSWTLL